MVNINTSIFKDYDIRGTYPDQLNEDTYFILGKAVSEYFKVNEIAVGHDARVSSPPLSESFVKGILSSGTNVCDLGMISTEIHNFASGNLGFEVNCIISASHNPGNYNGLKVVKKGVIPIHGSKGIPEIRDLALKNEFVQSGKEGKYRKQDIMGEWISYALGFVDAGKIRPFKVVIDAGNGMGGISWEKLMGKVPFEIIPLYFEPDGRFPNHLPDPLKDENMKDLADAVRKNKADIGFATDGDADRIFLVDDKGRPVSGTITTAILSKHLLKKMGKAPVLFNTACGKIVPETIAEMGGKPIRVRVGHSFIKEYMRDYKAIFAGEHSGHFYLSNNNNSESALITGLYILEYLSTEERKFSDVVDSYSKYFSSGEHSFKVQDPGKTIENVEKHFSGTAKTDHIDGLSVWFADWWFNLRASKTEPLIRLNMEADTKEILEKRFNEVKELII